MKLILLTLLLTSCSTYKWVDLNKCKEKVNGFAKCKVVE